MTRVDVKAIRARADAATSGPWTYLSTVDEFDPETDDPADLCGVFGPQYPGSTIDSIGEAETPQDIRFIAAARSDVPMLCDRVEALEAALSVALGLYTNPDAESEVGYAQYRMACAVLEGQ